LNWAIIKLDVDLFKLQRRASARIEIPDEINAEFILKQLGSNKYDVLCKVKDVSTGGIKAELPIGAPTLKIGDRVQGILRFGNRRPFDFEMEARFVQKIATGEIIEEQTSVPFLPSNQVQIAGFQFLKIDSVIESRMLTILMDIQREIYVKTVKKR
jgi:c-di-GMP-binding flagellar brake protein YcgR